MLVVVCYLNSTASLPTVLNCLTKKLRLSEHIVKFVIPVGTTVNTNGTAIYQTVAACFIAQLNEIELSWIEYIIIGLTGTASSYGVASIPTSIVLSMVVVLQSVNVPSKDISLIFAVDFLM